MQQIGWLYHDASGRSWVTRGKKPRFYPPFQVDEPVPVYVEDGVEVGPAPPPRRAEKEAVVKDKTNE